MKVAQDVYTPYVAVNKRGSNAIYGTIVAGLLYYRKFATSLTDKGCEMNPHDPCVWNKVIKSAS